jgi:hypothetical protein
MLDSVTHFVVVVLVLVLVILIGKFKYSSIIRC